MLGLECCAVCSRDVDVDSDRSDVFEMDMEKNGEISCPDKVTNYEVLRSVNEDGQILN